MTVDNVGVVPLAISDVQLTGGDSGDFALATALPLVVPAMSSGSFSATFTPQAAGTRSAIVTITSAAPSSPDAVGLTGVGLAPVLTVTPGALASGDVRLGSTSASQSFTIRNDGTAAMTVTSVAIPGANAVDYSVTGVVGTLAPSAE